jgi:outer membrane protein assembly factor BamB
MDVSGTKLIIAETERKIVAVNAADGKTAWETPYAVQGRGYNASTPMVEGQTLIFAGSNRGTRAVKLEKEGDKFVGKELWNNPEKSVQFNTPVVKNGLIYGLGIYNMKGALVCYTQAVKALMRAGVKLDGDVTIAAVVGEIE